MVFDAWLKKMRMTSPWSRLPPNWFFAAQRSLIDRLLRHPATAVLVACRPTNPDQAFGFLVVEGANRLLHWIYTKDAFRRARVARRLLVTAFGDELGKIGATVATPDLRLLLPGVRVDSYPLTERAR